MATTAIIKRIFCMCPTPYALAGIIRSTFAKRTAPAILAHLYRKPNCVRGQLHADRYKQLSQF